MKMNHKLSFTLNPICLLIIIALISGVFTAYAAETDEKNIINISTGEWSPWSGKEVPNNGFVLHIVREVFENAGYKVNYQFVPWKRAIIILEKGKVDASAYWYKDEKRDAFAYHSEPVTNEKQVFFYKKTTPVNDWNSLEDLKGFKIGLSRGITYPEELQNLIDSKVLTGEVVNDDLLNFRKLVHGRIDLFPGAEVAGNEILSKEFPPDTQETIGYSSKPLSVTTGHILFSKKSPKAEEYLKVFNEGLQKIRESGTYDNYFKALLRGDYSK